MGPFHHNTAAARVHVLLVIRRGGVPSLWLDRPAVYLSVLWWWAITAQFIIVGAGKTASANTITFAICGCIAGGLVFGGRRNV